MAMQPPKTILQEKLDKLNDPNNDPRYRDSYVAGLGRGAQGFTTSFELGASRDSHARDPVFGAAPAGYVGGRGRGLGSRGSQLDGAGRSWEERTGGVKRDMPSGGGGDQARVHAEDMGETEDFSTFDEWSGGGGDTFSSANAVYDDEDREADELYAAIDERMDQKRRDRREKILKQKVNEFRGERPKIQAQFADAKADLATLSPEDWDIPDAKDYSRYNKRIKQQIQNRYERFTPTPDTLLDAARRSKEVAGTVLPDAQKYGLDTPMSVPGASSAAGSAAAPTDLTQVGEARKDMLGVQLDKVSDSVTGQTVVDPKGYLTQLTNRKITSDAEVGDIKKARLLLKSVITTNPSHAPGWIAAARLEEVVGKIGTARNIISQGCEACAGNEDVWLENARLQTPDVAKSILADAVKKVPQSVKIWLRAADLEDQLPGKKRVLRRALEMIPNSVRLWKVAVGLEADPDDARIMLGRAVECVPHAVDIWIALAQLETYENARKVLNLAREAVPTDHRIWINAAMLEEANDNTAMVDKIIVRGVKSLAAQQIVVDREEWLAQAEACEKKEDNPSVATCQAIVRAVIDIGVEDEDRKTTYLEDAENSIRRQCVETPRAIYAHALTVFPGKASIWLRAAQLEKQFGTSEALDQLLKKAVTYCPQAEVLWLMAAKERWLAGDVPGARAILNEAFAANPDSEQIWLAAVKLEWVNKEYERAEKLLEKGRERASTESVWMKSAMLQRELKHDDKERELLKGGCERFPYSPKLWMMAGQLEERVGKMPAARDLYAQGLKKCPGSVPLWLCAAALEEKAAGAGKARSVLEKARLKNSQNEDLWLAAVRLEERAGEHKVAMSLLSKALSQPECPSSGKLWAEAIGLEARPQQKARSVDALKKCEDDPYVVIAVARRFQADRKLEKARKWFERAVKLMPGLGDGWAAYYALELQYGTPETQSALTARCVKAEPHYGEQWIKISKDLNNIRAHLDSEAILKKAALLMRQTNPFK